MSAIYTTSSKKPASRVGLVSNRFVEESGRILNKPSKRLDLAVRGLYSLFLLPIQLEVVF